MRAVLPGVLCLLAGCAPTDVVDIGHGQYSVTATSPSAGYYGSREEAVERANDFCARHDQAAAADAFYDKPEVGPLGEHTSTILFRCVPPRVLKF
jgi:hypothetical protein